MLVITRPGSPIPPRQTRHLTDVDRVDTTLTQSAGGKFLLVYGLPGVGWLTTGVHPTGSPELRGVRLPRVSLMPGSKMNPTC